MDIFDILGPVMVGPSSSHTAGAARIGKMARTLLGGEPMEAKIHLHGSFAETGSGHGTDRALVAGLLGMNPDDMRIPFAGDYNTLVGRNHDENGTLAAVTTILSQLRINVANMSLCRHKRDGDALMVIETDQHIKPHQVSFLAELPGILSVTYYDKEDEDHVS